ncbi:AAA family ATPase [Pseudovibrio ascidiaceicola]|uniref:AAA family ATPase n=1 Tax=Pseudovibrio ascidiaceicola TaxID=285279 RepID=UPI003D36F9C1
MTAVTIARASTLLEHYINKDMPVFLWGDVGIGKSDSVAAVASKHDADLLDIRLSMFDPVDLRGLPTIQNGETIWLKPAIWPKDECKPTFLFFDEFDRASPAVQSAALQIVLNRRIGEHKLPDNVRIIAAGNGSTDRVGTQRTSAAGNNRFAHVQAEPDLDSWRRWAATSGLHPMVIAFVSFRPELLHKRSDKHDKSFPTPRSWASVAEFADAPETIRMDLVTGLIGQGAAAEFEGFVRVFKNLPSLDAVIADPTGSRVPKDPAARYAITAGLAVKATMQNFQNIITYLERLPQEFSVLGVVDACRRDESLTHTSTYTQWAVDHQDVTL